MASTLRKTPLAWLVVWLLAMAVGTMALVATAQTARADDADTGPDVTPTPIDYNATCKDLLVDKNAFEIKVDPPKSGTYGPITVNVRNNGTVVDFQSTVPVLSVFVKGGRGGGGNYYDYSSLGGSSGDTNLIPNSNQSQQISHVSFCWNSEPTPPSEALKASKTAVATYDHNVDWKLKKTADDNSHSGDAGQTAGTSNWKVEATKTATDSDLKVTGVITITNPNDKPVDFDVYDTLDDGTVGNVDCDQNAEGDQAFGTVGPKSSKECPYTSLPTTMKATQNNVLVDSKTDGIPGTTALASFTWKGTVKGDETVKLSDPRFPTNTDLNRDINDSATVVQPETFECPSDPAKYTDGKYTYTETNNAFLEGASTDLSAKADVNVDCSLAALKASKTAAGTYDRNIDWKLEKSVAPASHSGLAGDSFTSNYTIKATKTVTDGNYKVTGNITINNPASISQSFSVVDELDKPAGTMANVDCNSDLAGDQPSAVVPAGTTYVCTYTASTGTATLNTATVRATGNGDVKATAPVSYTANVTGDQSVTLSDPTYLSPQTISDTTTKTFPATFKCSTNPADYTNYWDTDTYNNTAYLKGVTTNLSSKASVTVKCRNPWQSETATGAGLRYPGTSNWFMYTPYQTTKVDLIAGQNYDAGDIYLTRPGDGSTYVKVTLASGFRFANATQNLKIQDFASAPKSFVQPGNFKYKFNVAQGTSTYTAKIPGNTAKFYGIHADVERYVP